MPTASPSPAPLAAEQVDHLRAELDAGRSPMVWFTEAAVGVDAGRSAKVVALGDPAEGDFIQVRPTGSQDELSFSTNELTLAKPPRRRRPPEPAAEVEAEAPPPTTDELLITRDRPRPAKTAKPEAVTETPEPTPEAADKADNTDKAEKSEKRSKPGRPKPPMPVTVTLHSTPEGEWTVEVQAGTRRAVRPQPIAAAAVAAAAKSLGGDIEEAISGALAAARERQRARVVHLESALAAARRALADLTD
jgi:Family of unknown function (DUF6319)